MCGFARALNDFQANLISMEIEWYHGLLIHASEGTRSGFRLQLLMVLEHPHQIDRISRRKFMKFSGNQILNGYFEY